MSTRASVLGLTLAIALVWAPLIMAQGTQDADGHRARLGA